MQKIVINKCYGSFGLSEWAIKKLVEIKGLYFYTLDDNMEYLKVDNWEEDRFIGESKTSTEINNSKIHHNAIYFKAKRDDKDLVELVQNNSEKVNSPYSRLKVVEIPDGVEWEIEEYEGHEWVAEKHRTWS